MDLPTAGNAIVIGRLVICVVVVGSAVYALYSGIRLCGLPSGYTEMPESRFEFSAGETKFAASMRSIGALIAATSCIWALAAWLFLPSLQMSSSPDTSSLSVGLSIPSIGAQGLTQSGETVIVKSVDAIVPWDAGASNDDAIQKVLNGYRLQQEKNPRQVVWVEYKPEGEAAEVAKELVTRLKAAGVDRIITSPNTGAWLSKDPTVTFVTADEERK